MILIFNDESLKINLSGRKGILYSICVFFYHRIQKIIATIVGNKVLMISFGEIHLD